MKNKLHVLIIPPLYGGSLPIARYCAQAMSSLGHFAVEFDSPAFLSGHSALRSLQVGNERLEQLDAAFVNLLSQAIFAKAEAMRPDLVLALAQAPLNRQILSRLRKAGIPTAMWFVEDYEIFPYWRAFAPLYDFFFIIQKEPFLEILHSIGVKNACYLPLGALPSFHSRPELSPAEVHRFGSDLSFMGAGYPNRRMAFHNLAHRNFKIWGSDWDGERLLAGNIQEQGRRIQPEESLRIFSASKINLNLHSSVKQDQLVNYGDFVNPRTFELAMLQAFQLVDRRLFLDELFVTSDAATRGDPPPDDAEMAVFSDLPSLEASIAYYLAHPEQREKLAANARKRALAEHTYEQRMMAVIDFVAARLPDWPKDPPELAWPEDLDPDFKQQLKTLLQKLDLPSDAPFAEVIARVREQNGVLDGLETSLLFLDEWRKQYLG